METNKKTEITKDEFFTCKNQWGRDSQFMRKADGTFWRYEETYQEVEKEYYSEESAERTYQRKLKEYEEAAALYEANKSIWQNLSPVLRWLRKEWPLLFGKPFKLEKPYRPFKEGPLEYRYVWGWVRDKSFDNEFDEEGF